MVLCTCRPLLDADFSNQLCCRARRATPREDVTEVTGSRQQPFFEVCSRPSLAWCDCNRLTEMIIVYPNVHEILDTLVWLRYKYCFSGQNLAVYSKTQFRLVNHLGKPFCSHPTTAVVAIFGISLEVTKIM